MIGYTDREKVILDSAGIGTKGPMVGRECRVQRGDTITRFIIGKAIIRIGANVASSSICILSTDGLEIYWWESRNHGDPAWYWGDWLIHDVGVMFDHN